MPVPLTYILGITKKSFVLPFRPCTDRDEIKLKSVSVAITDLCISNFIQIGRHLGEWRPKNLFLLVSIIEDGQAYGWTCIAFEYAKHRIP